MRPTLTALALTIAVAVTAHAADDNPLKNAKTGDSVTYSKTTKMGQFGTTGTMTYTITAMNDKEAKIKVTGEMDISGVKYKEPERELKIDLSKPFDPTQFAGYIAGTEAKAEKDKDGKEKVKVGGKEYECTWTTYKVQAKFSGKDFQSQIKVWTSKDVPTGVVKLTVMGTSVSPKDEITFELKEVTPKK